MGKYLIYSYEVVRSGFDSHTPSPIFNKRVRQDKMKYKKKISKETRQRWEYIKKHRFYVSENRVIVLNKKIDRIKIIVYNIYVKFMKLIRY